MILDTSQLMLRNKYPHFRKLNNKSLVRRASSLLTRSWQGGYAPRTGQCVLIYKPELLMNNHCISALAVLKSIYFFLLL